MSLQLIENQVLNFKNALIDDPCGCKGKPFVRKVNKNDITEAEFISTAINSETEFNNIGSWQKVLIGEALNPNPAAPCLAYYNIEILIDEFYAPTGFFKFTFSNPFCPITGGLFEVNQNRFSVDNGITWHNETTNPLLEVLGSCGNYYNVIVEDTIFGIIVKEFEEPWLYPC